MALFNISPSEAVLIGCCMGEYLEARQDNEYANVLQFFWKWLSPVVPNFETSTTTPITEDELPQGLEWQKSDRGFLALDAGDGTVFYEKCASGITCTRCERTRSSLLNLLADLVDPFVTKSFNDNARFPSHENLARARQGEDNLRGVMKYLSEHGEDDPFEADIFMAHVASTIQTPNSPDDTAAVLETINRLISENAIEDYFLIGRLFGKTSATLERWEQSLYSDPFFCYLPEAEYRNEKRMWSYRKDQVLTDEYHANVKSLLGARLVQECSHAVSVLRVESNRAVSTEYDEPNPVGLLRAGLCFAEARAAIWFALGNLLGTLRGVDNAARERDLRSLTPRPYMLSSRASAEQIAGLIRMVDETFSDPGDKNLQPEYLVNCLANAIEGLTKRLWPKEFDQDSRKGELRNVLQAHCATGSEAERRFSRLALTLYDVYRKPVSHGLGVFRCTWEEARFFHAGIRTLHKLSEEIEQSRPKP
jgi:hypothetical protein